MSETKPYDVVVVGGGVTGGADAFGFSKYSNVRRVLMLEKYANVGMVNSNPMNNAQTRHDGGTETNYSLEKALKVQQAARMMDSYVLSKNDRTLSRTTKRMVLGVGPKEVRQLEDRFREFGRHYPDLRLVYGEELKKIEPKVMEGRDPEQPVGALVSDRGVTINYQRLAEHFVADAGRLNLEFHHEFMVEVERVSRRGDGLYLLKTNKGDFVSRAVIFAAGSYSLLFAQQLGYGTEYGILSVAGSFYSAPNLLDNKVYRVQVEGRPFAEIHGDPDILNPRITRFGPTTKPLPLMERYNYSTFFDFIKLPLFSLKGLATLVKILVKNKLVGYVARNMLYDLPVIGKALFLREAHVIVPTLRYRDLKHRKHAGGVRPQIVNLTTGQLEMGDKTIVGDGVIFNTTPSPGASVCLANAKRDVEKLVQMLGPGYHFDKAAWERDLEGKPDVSAACKQDPHVCPGI